MLRRSPPVFCSSRRSHQREQQAAFANYFSSSRPSFSSSSPSSSSYVTTRSGQTYLFLLQNKWPVVQTDASATAAEGGHQHHHASLSVSSSSPPLLEEGCSTHARHEDVVLQKLLFDEEQQQQQQQQNPLRGGGDGLARELASILTSTSSATGKVFGWSKALSLISSALAEKRNILAAPAERGSSATVAASKPPPPPPPVHTLHFNLALAICARCAHWPAMQRCEASMAVNNVAADAHTLNLFMDASCSSGDWANALELFASAVKASDAAAAAACSSRYASGTATVPLFNPRSISLALEAVSTGGVTSQQRKFQTQFLSDNSSSRWWTALRIYGRFPRTIERHQGNDTSRMLAVIVHAASSRQESQKALLRTWEDRWRFGSGGATVTTASAALLEERSYIDLSTVAERCDAWSVALELASGAVALGPGAGENIVSRLVSAALRTAVRSKKADTLALDLLRRYSRQRQQLVYERDGAAAVLAAAASAGEEESMSGNVGFFALEPTAIDAASTLCARLGKFQELVRLKDLSIDSLGYASSGVYTALLRLLENRFEYVVAYQQKQKQQQQQQQQQTSAAFDPDAAVSQQRTVLHEFLSQCRDSSAVEKIASDSVAWLCLDVFRGMFEEQQQNAATEAAADSVWATALSRLAAVTRQPDAMVFAVALEIVRSAAAPSTDAALQVLAAAAASAAGAAVQNTHRSSRKPFAVTLHDALEIFTAAGASEATEASNFSPLLGRATQIAIELGFQGTTQFQRAITLLQLGWFKERGKGAAAAATASFSAVMIPLLVRIDQKSTSVLSTGADQRRLGEDVVSFAATKSNDAGQRKLVLAFFLRRLFLSPEWAAESRDMVLSLLRNSSVAQEGIAVEFSAAELDWLHDSLTMVARNSQQHQNSAEEDGSVKRKKNSIHRLLLEHLFAAARLVAVWGQNSNALYRLPDGVAMALLSATVAVQKQEQQHVVEVVDGGDGDNSSDESSNLWRHAMSIFGNAQSFCSSSSSSSLPVLGSGKLLEQNENSAALFDLVHSCLLAGDADTATRLLCDKRRPQRLDSADVSQFLSTFLDERGASPETAAAISSLVARAADFYGQEWPRRVRVKLLQSQWSSVGLLAERRLAVVKRMMGNRQQQQQQQQRADAICKVNEHRSRSSSSRQVTELFVSHLTAAPETITVQAMVCVVRSIINKKQQHQEDNDDSDSSSSKNQPEEVSTRELQRVLSSVQAADVNGKLTGRAALALAAEWFFSSPSSSSLTRAMTVPVLLQQLLRQALAEGLRVSDSVWRGATAVALARAASIVVIAASAVARQEFRSCLSLFVQLNPDASPDVFFPLLADTLSAMSSVAEKKEEGQQEEEVSSSSFRLEPDSVLIVALAICRCSSREGGAETNKQQEDDDFRADFFSQMLHLDNGGDALFGCAPTRTITTTSSCSSSSSSHNIFAVFRDPAVLLLVTAIDDSKFGSIQQPLAHETVAAVCEMLVGNNNAGAEADNVESCKQRVATLLQQVPATDSSAVLLPFVIFGSSSCSPPNSITSNISLDVEEKLRSLTEFIRAAAPPAVGVVAHEVAETALRRMATAEQEAAPNPTLYRHRFDLFLACAEFALRQKSAPLLDLLEAVPAHHLADPSSCSSSSSIVPRSAPVAAALLVEHALRRPKILRCAWRRQEQLCLLSNSNNSSGGAGSEEKPLVLEQVLQTYLSDNEDKSSSERGSSSGTPQIQVGCQILADSLKQLLQQSERSSSLVAAASAHLEALLEFASTRKSTNRAIITATVHEHCVLLARLLEPEIVSRSFDMLLKPALFAFGSGQEGTRSYSALLVAHAHLTRQQQQQQRGHAIEEMSLHGKAIREILPAALLIQRQQRQQHRRGTGKKKAAAVDEGTLFLLAEMAAWRFRATASLAASPDGALCAYLQMCSCTKTCRKAIEELMQRLSSSSISRSSNHHKQLIMAVLRAAAAAASSTESDSRLFTVAFQQLSLALRRGTFGVGADLASARALFVAALERATAHCLLLDPNPALQSKIRRDDRNNTPLRVPVLVTTPALRAAVRCATTLGCVEQLVGLCRSLKSHDAVHYRMMLRGDGGDAAAAAAAEEIIARLERGICLLHLPLAVLARRGGGGGGGGSIRHQQQETHREEEELAALCVKEKIFGGDSKEVLSSLLPMVAQFGAAMSRLDDSSPLLLHLETFDDSLAQELLALSFSRNKGKAMWLCLEGQQPKVLSKTLFGRNSQRAMAAGTPEGNRKKPERQQQQQRPQRRSIPQKTLWRDALIELQSLTAHRRGNKDWSSSVARLGGAQRLDFLFAMHMPWALASAALAQVCRAVVDGNNDAPRSFLATVSRAHLRNVSSSLPQNQGMKSAQARALATALFLATSNDNDDKHAALCRQHPRLVPDLLRHCAWLGGSATNWEVCFRLYSTGQQRQKEERVGETEQNYSGANAAMLISLVYAVHRSTVRDESWRREKVSMVVTHFCDLKAKRGVVLGRNEVAKFSRVVSLFANNIDVKLMENLLK